MKFILGGNSMGMKIIESRHLLISFVLAFLVSCSCDKSPTCDGNHYDPRNVSRNEGLSYGASLAVDDKGNIHLVWADSTPGNYEILYSTKSSGGDWFDPVNISNTDIESTCPEITVDPSGNLHVVWGEGGFYTSETLGVYYSMKPYGENWTIPMEIANRGEMPDIGIDASGNVHVTWLGWVSYRMKSAEGIWMPKEDVFPFGINHDHAVNNQGDVHVVCDGPGANGGGENISYTMKPFGGSWAEPENISESLSRSWAPTIAADDGNVYAAWKEVRPGVDQIFFRICSSDGSWSEIDSLPDIVGDATGPEPAITAENGNLHFLWGAAIDGWDIYYKVRNRDGSWSESFNISNTGEAGPAIVVVDTYGNLHVAWSDESPGNYDIFYTVISTR